MLSRTMKIRLLGSEYIAPGLYYGYLPKVGSKGLIVFPSRFNGAWEIKLPKNFGVGNYWFQVIDETGWQWSHGIVTSKGEVTQIG